MKCTGACMVQLKDKFYFCVVVLLVCILDYITYEARLLAAYNIPPATLFKTQQRARLRVFKLGLQVINTFDKLLFLLLPSTTFIFRRLVRHLTGCAGC